MKDGRFQYGLRWLGLAPEARASIRAFVSAKPGR
jgi:hypothetical protein